MGVTIDYFRFTASRPDLAAVRVEIKRRLGSDSAIHDLIVADGMVEATTMLEPFARAVVCAVLEEAGGKHVERAGGTMPLAVPDWARRPLSELGWSGRMAIRYRWWAWLVGSARK